MIDMINQKLKVTLTDREIQSREAVLIALQQLDDSHPSHYLSNFSGPLQFDSFVLFRCFTNAKSFNSLNTITLSAIYLTELTFDTHVLQMYISGNYKNKIFPLEELEQQWNDLLKNQEMITYKAAIWITNYLQRAYKDDLTKVIKDMSCWWMIEKEALSIIVEWLTYRNDKDLSFFAQYAALQLFINHSNIPDLIYIINEMFSSASRFHFNSLFWIWKLNELSAIKINNLLCQGTHFY